jgi:ABC-type nickel/cobalt efflux system permease component RcnA
MHNRNYVPVSIVFALLFWVIDSLVHWRIYGEDTFEILPTNLYDFWMRIITFVLLVCFGIYANYHTKRLITKEEEKRKIFKATADTSQHILNVFLNKMMSFKDEAQKVDGFDEETLKLLENAVRNTTNALDTLRNVSDISVENIIISVHPENGH